MLRHVVMFRWAPDASSDALGRVSRGLEGLPAAISAVAKYRHGPDAGLADGNWDYVVVADFADEEAYREYRDHPAHQSLIADHIRPIVADRAAVQHRLDG
ncbi:MAG: Dabb family protein [Microthrixaceae bacterium]